MTERIAVDLPLHIRHASTVRVVAASVAADAGFTIDEIEDLRLGVNEAFSVLADVEPDDAARLTVEFERDDGSVRVVARRSGIDAPLPPDAPDGLARRILGAVVDEYRVDPDGVFTVVKRSSGEGHDAD